MSNKLTDDPLWYAASLLAFAAYDCIPGHVQRNRSIAENWEALVKEFEAGSPHDGDCRGKPQSCMRCAVINAMLRGKGLIRFLGGMEKEEA